MDILLHKNIAAAFINRVIIANHPKQFPVLPVRVFSAVNKTQNGAAIPIPESVNLFGTHSCRV